MKRLFLIFIFFIGFSSNNSYSDQSSILTSFIKARSKPSLVLPPEILVKVKEKEHKYHVDQVGDIADEIKISRSTAAKLGYLPLEGQRIEELKDYPELVEVMKKKNQTHLPDYRLKLIFDN